MCIFWHWIFFWHLMFNIYFTFHMGRTIRHPYQNLSWDNFNNRYFRLYVEIKYGIYPIYNVNRILCFLNFVSWKNLMQWCSIPIKFWKDSNQDHFSLWVSRCSLRIFKFRYLQFLLRPEILYSWDKFCKISVVKSGIVPSDFIRFRILESLIWRSFH